MVLLVLSAYSTHVLQHRGQVNELAEDGAFIDRHAALYGLDELFEQSIGAAHRSVDSSLSTAEANQPRICHGYGNDLWRHLVCLVHACGAQPDICLLLSRPIDTGEHGKDMGMKMETEMGMGTGRETMGKGMVEM